MTVASIKSSYAEISYTSATRRTAITGTLFSNVSANPSGFVSASISVPIEMGLDYSTLELEVNFLQSSNKTNRSIRSRSLNKNRVFYRGFSTSLDAQINAYKPYELAPILPTPVLLLNSLSSKEDKFYGDCAIQPCVRVHYSNKNAKGSVLMSPEAISRITLETVGLSILTSPSINHVIDEIIDTSIAELISAFIIPINMIDNTQDLSNDIKRYLEYAYYGA